MVQRLWHWRGDPWVPKLVQALRFTLGFGIYALASIGLVLLMPCLFVLSGARIERFRTTIRTLARVFFRFVIWYVRCLRIVDVRRCDHAGGELGQILVANHISMFDIISAIAFFPDHITFIKANFLLNPIVRPVALAAGFIPVDPRSQESRRAAYLKAYEVVSQGGRLIVFPEGTRTATGTLGPFQDGAFRLAVETHSAITPLVFTSSRPVFAKVPSGPIDLRCIDYRLHIMPVMGVAGDLNQRKAAAALRGEVRRRFEGWLKEPWVYAWQRLRPQTS